MRSLLLSAFSVVAMLTHAEVRWSTATVLHAQYRLEHSTGIAGGGGTTVARGEFEFDADKVIHTAEESVTPGQRLMLKPGDTVEFAIDKKTLMLKVKGNKVRKLKLLTSEPKRGN